MALDSVPRERHAREALDRQSAAYVSARLIVDLPVACGLERTVGEALAPRADSVTSPDFAPRVTPASPHPLNVLTIH